jgi:hypothetical protein
VFCRSTDARWRRRRPPMAGKKFVFKRKNFQYFRGLY